MAKILVVEDDPTLQRLYMNILKREGYELELAGDGEIALQKVAEFKPDLILLDVIMPHVNGIEVLVQLKTDPQTQNILIIVFTNGYTDKSAQSAKALGITEFLIKSNTEPDILQAKVRSILQEHGIV